jgi:gluconolactonase
MKPTEGHAGELEYGDNYVFRFDPRDGSVVPAVIDVETPNGLAFSPDESLLYVADSGASPPTGERDPDRPGGHSIHVYDVFDGRLCKNGREFVEVSPGVPDGFRVDEHGNVWTSSHDSVQVFDPAGTQLLRIPVPEKIANLCFGGDDGRTVYIVASTSLYRIRSTVRDAAALLRAK